MEIFDIRGKCDDTTYQPCSSRVLATHKVYVDSFRSIYPINAGIAGNAAVATGRYPEDTYYNGMYGKSIYQQHDTDSIKVTRGSSALLLLLKSSMMPPLNSVTRPLSPSTAPRWRSSSSSIPAPRLALTLLPHLLAQLVSLAIRPLAMLHLGARQRSRKPTTSPKSSLQWLTMLTVRYASANPPFIIRSNILYTGFVDIVQQYGPANGTFPEQYNRTTGEGLSAFELTWSMAAFVSMAQRRSGQYPATWKPNTNRGIASTCQSSAGTLGTYAPATMAGAPSVDMSCTVQVTFNVNASTTFGENVYMTGNLSSIGNWAPGYAPMVPINYPIWSYQIQAEPNSVINYKYVHQESASYVLETANRTFTVPACGNGRLQVSTNDVFGPANITITQDFCNPDVNHCW